MSGSSSTINRLGWRSSGMGFDAFQEGALQRRFPVALAQPAGRAHVGHRSLVENRDAVADLLDVGERMRGEKQGSPLGLEVQEQVPGAIACLGVQAAHRLVENVQIALRKKAGGKPQFLGHALRIGADRLVEGSDLQIERSEHCANALLLVSAFEQSQHHRYELATGKKVWGGKSLGQERKTRAGPRTAVRGAVDLDRTRIEVAEVEQALDQGGLAGAVHTGQAHALARMNVEIDSAQHFGATKALAHSEESNRRLGHKAALRGEASMIAQRRRSFTAKLRLPRDRSRAAQVCRGAPFWARIRPSRNPEQEIVATSNLVEVQNVTFGYDERQVLKDINLVVPQGKVVAIMGLSGCGKTTLLRVIGGALLPDRGEVRVAGRVVNKLSDPELFALRRRMGMLFQFGALFTDLSSFENVAFQMREHTNLPESIIRDLALMKLQAVGLRGAADLMPSELSGGMARRVALARSISLGARITDNWVWRLGFAFRFLWFTLKESGASFRRFHLTIREIYFTGVLSLIIILVSGLFVGMVLALQGYDTLVRFGSSEVLGVL